MKNWITNYLLFGQRPGQRPTMLDKLVNFPAGTTVGQLISQPVSDHLTTSDLQSMCGKANSDQITHCVCPLTAKLVEAAKLLDVTPEEIQSTAGYFCGQRMKNLAEIGMQGYSYQPETFCQRLVKALSHALNYADQAVTTRLRLNGLGEIVVEVKTPEEIIEQAMKIKSAFLGKEILDFWLSLYPNMNQAAIIEKIRAEQKALIEKLGSAENPNPEIQGLRRRYVKKGKSTFLTLTLNCGQMLRNRYVNEQGDGLDTQTVATFFDYLPHYINLV